MEGKLIDHKVYIDSFPKCFEDFYTKALNNLHPKFKFEAFLRTNCRSGLVEQKTRNAVTAVCTKAGMGKTADGKTAVCIEEV